MPWVVLARENGWASPAAWQLRSPLSSPPYSKKQMKHRRCRLASGRRFPKVADTKESSASHTRRFFQSSCTTTERAAATCAAPWPSTTHPPYSQPRGQVWSCLVAHPSSQPRKTREKTTCDCHHRQCQDLRKKEGASVQGLHSVRHRPGEVDGTTRPRGLATRRSRIAEHATMCRRHLRGSGTCPTSFRACDWERCFHRHYQRCYKAVLRVSVKADAVKKKKVKGVKVLKKGGKRKGKRRAE